MSGLTPEEQMSSNAPQVPTEDSNAVQDQIPTPDQSSSGQIPAPGQQPIVAGQPMQVAPGQQPQPGQAPQPQGQPQPNAQPVQVVAAHPRAAMFHELLNVLGGGDKQTYSVDPATGQLTATAVPQTKGQLAKNILAGALVGLMAPKSPDANRGPGSAVAGFQQGAQAVQQQRQQQTEQAKQTAVEDYSRGENAKVRQMQTYEANLRLYQLAQNAGKLNRESLEQSVPLATSDQLDQWENENMLRAKGISEQESADVIKHHGGDWQRWPDGIVARKNAQGQIIYQHPDGTIGPDQPNGSYQLWDHTYALVDNKARTPLRDMTTQQTGPNTTTKTPGADLLPWVKKAAFYDIGGPGFKTAVAKNTLGNDMSTPMAANLQYQVGALDTVAAEIKNTVATLNAGLKPTDPNYNHMLDNTTPEQYLADQLKANPTLLASLKQAYLKAPVKSVFPDQQLASLPQTPQYNQARTDVTSLFGGPQSLDALAQARADAKTKADILTKGQAESQTPEGAQKLKDEKLNAQKTQLEIDAKRNELANGGLSETQQAAQNIVNGDLSSLKDITSYRGNQKTAMYNAIEKEAVRQGKDPKDFSPAALETKAALYKDYREGKTSNNIQAFDAFLGHANDAMDANDAWRRSRSPLINKPLTWLGKNVSNDPNYISFTTSLEPVRKEFMSFLNANRAEHEGDIQTMQTVLNDNNSPAQIEVALKQLGKSADIRLASIGRKYQNTIGAPFPNLVSDDGKATLQRMGVTSKAVPTMQQPVPQPQQQTVPTGNQTQPQAKPAPKPGLVSVQIPGQPWGYIPPNSMAAFKAKHPDAIIGQ